MFPRFMLGLYDGGASSNMLHLLTHSQSCGASDKRDHIYAFLDLASDEYELHVDNSGHLLLKRSLPSSLSLSLRLRKIYVFFSI